MTRNEKIGLIILPTLLSPAIGVVIGYYANAQKHVGTIALDQFNSVQRGALIGLACGLSLTIALAIFFYCTPTQNTDKTENREGDLTSSIDLGYPSHDNTNK